MLALEEPFARAYAKRFPHAEPYARLPEHRRREIRAYFESRGVIVNHRFGVTGRIGAYSALRRFTLGEQIGEEDFEPEAGEPEEIAPLAGKGFVLNAETERIIKGQLEELQRDWPEVSDKGVDAYQTRHRLLSRAQEILMPIALMAAKKAIGPHFSREDAQDEAQDAVVVWKAKMLRHPDQFIGIRPDKKQRNLVADIQKYVRYEVNNQYRKNKRREATPIASEHEREGGEGEPAIGMELTTHETPTSTLIGPEREREMNTMFRSVARDLARSPAYRQEADLLNKMIDTGSSDPHFLARELGWSMVRYNRVRAILGTYLKRRAETIPILKGLMRKIRESASAEDLRALCERFPALHLILDGLFLPAFKPCPMLRIYEKYEQFAEEGKVWALRTRKLATGGYNWEIVRIMDGRELHTPMRFGRKYTALAKLEELKRQGDSVVECEQGMAEVDEAEELTEIGKWGRRLGTAAAMATMGLGGLAGLRAGFKALPREGPRPKTELAVSPEEAEMAAKIKQWRSEEGLPELTPRQAQAQAAAEAEAAKEREAAAAKAEQERVRKAAAAKAEQERVRKAAAAAQQREEDEAYEYNMRWMKAATGTAKDRQDFQNWKDTHLRP